MQMTTPSHGSPIIPASLPRQPEGWMLDAFAECLPVSSRLEALDQALQPEWIHLSHELSRCTLALQESLAENRRIRRVLRQVVDAMPCGVLVVEDGGSVCMVNPAAQRLLELPLQQQASPSGQQASSTTASWDLQAVSQAIGVDLAALLCGDASSVQEQEFCCVLNGVRHWITISAHHLPASAQQSTESTQTLLILQDVTLRGHQEHAEQEREQGGAQAVALAAVATTLAHEIRNPLTSLELFAGLLEQGGEGAEDCLSYLQAGIRSLAGTVDNVLTFHGGGSPVLQPMPLEGTVRSSVEFARPIAMQAGVTLRFHGHAAPMRILSSASALQQLVLNMVSNAIRHTAQGGCVAVRVSPAELEDGRPAARITFTDTGSGIAAEHLPEIFRAGFSAGGTSSGLGLAVCSQIVQQHGGTIRVESCSGAGSGAGSASDSGAGSGAGSGSGTTFFVEIPTL